MSVAKFDLHYYSTIAWVYGVIFVLGFLLNTGVLIVFLVTPSLRRCSSNYILISMTVSDWMMASLSSSVGVYANSRYWWTLPYSVCQYFGFISALVGFSSMVHITALAAEKWSTLKRMTSEEIPKKKMITIVVCLWLFALIWAIFPLTVWSSFAPEPGYAGCSIKWYSNKISDKAYIICLFVLFFFIPICIVSFCFICIYMEVKKITSTAAARWGMSSDFTRQTLFAKAKTIRMSLVMVCAFIFAWAPYAIVSLYSSFIANDLAPLSSTVPALFAKLSTFYNPVIYFFMFKRFRKAALRLLTRGNFISPQAGSGSTSPSNGGSFATSFPRPGQFLSRFLSKDQTVSVSNVHQADKLREPSQVLHIETLRIPKA